MVSRTLVLELNLARVNGALEGATSEERFASFVDGLGRSERALQVLIDYPVLARQATRCVTNWVRAAWSSPATSARIGRPCTFPSRWITTRVR